MLEAEEDVALLARCGFDTLFTRVFDIDEYARQRDRFTVEQKAELYRFHKKQLQMILWYDPDYNTGR